MSAPPEDAVSRRESLEQWVAEQGEKGRTAKPSEATGSVSALERVRTRLGFGRGGPKAVLASRVHRFAERVLDRGLDTAAPAIEPEHGHPDNGPYGPSAWHVLPRALRYLR